MKIFQILGIINIYLGILHVIFMIIFKIRGEIFIDNLTEEIIYTLICICSLFIIPANIICLILYI